MSPADSKQDTGGRPSRPLLTASQLKKRYGAFEAVKGVDFTIDTNSYVTLLGPSGCGKTSILRMIGGFEDISGGTLELNGVSLAGTAANQRSVNTVFQNYALFPHLSVADNVGFGLAYKNIGQAQIASKVQATLAMVQMTPMAERRPRQLSGGQQQRVALARAINNEPELLLLDEPLSALDRRMRKDMQIELKDLQRRLGMTFLHVTHDQEEAFALSDQIIVMNHGLIEQHGTPSDIYHRPASAYVADFIGGANLVAGRVISSTDTSVTIETPLGRFETPGVAGLSAGSNAVLCLRPEQLHLSNDGPLEVQVTHNVFRGAEWLIEARASDDTLLSFMVQDGDIPQPGTTARLGFHPAQAWIAPTSAGEK
jgi:ABC-type Fe3+/spermidine/putrescine transport system ATPase subunit